LAVASWMKWYAEKEQTIRTARDADIAARDKRKEAEAKRWGGELEKGYVKMDDYYKAVRDGMRKVQELQAVLQTTSNQKSADRLMVAIDNTKKWTEGMRAKGDQ